MIFHSSFIYLFIYFYVGFVLGEGGEGGDGGLTFYVIDELVWGLSGLYRKGPSLLSFYLDEHFCWRTGSRVMIVTHSQ